MKLITHNCAGLGFVFKAHQLSHLPGSKQSTRTTPCMGKRNSDPATSDRLNLPRIPEITGNVNLN